MDFSDVKEQLRAEDVFTDPSHRWKTQGDRRWKGGCPWHESSSGTCFAVDPQTLDWHCFHCERGGGPLEYVAELKRLGNAGFVEKWKALSEHAGCPGPEKQNGETKRRQRRPLRQNQRARRRKPTTAEAGTEPQAYRSASTTSRQDRSERELRTALVRYRRALTSSETEAAAKARAYVRDRGLSVETLHAHGCGYAPPGEWLQDTGPNGEKHRAPAGRIVTPHTVPTGTPERPSNSRSPVEVVNLYGREASSGAPRWRKHRHLSGPKGLFNARAIIDGDGPLVVCESSLDALSFIEAGHARAVAVHGKSGLPWQALRGNVDTVVIALDTDATAEAKELADGAVLRDIETYTLHDEDAYGGHGDPNEALQAGALDLTYIRELGGDLENDPMNAPAEGPESTAHDPGGEAAPPPTGTESAESAARGAHEAADLIPYWGGTAVGYLGRWIWTRRRAPIGRVDDTLHADRELHAWIAGELQRGPEKARDPERLETVLWKLYVAFSEHGPGAPPAAGTLVQAPFNRHGSEGTVRESHFDPRRRTYRVAVQPRDGMPMDTRYFDRSELETSQT